MKGNMKLTNHTYCRGIAYDIEKCSLFSRGKTQIVKEYTQMIVVSLKNIHAYIYTDKNVEC